MIVVLGASGDLAKKKTVRVTAKQQQNHHPMGPQRVNWLTCPSFLLSLDS